MKKLIYLVVVVFLFLGCLGTPKTKNIEYVNVDSIEVYKKFDPVTQSYQIIYIACFELNGKTERMRVKNNRTRIIRVHEYTKSE